MELETLRSDMIAAMKAKDKANKGAIMKVVMADMKGKADGKVINQTVAELCK